MKNNRCIADKISWSSLRQLLTWQYRFSKKYKFYLKNKPLSSK